MTAAGTSPGTSTPTTPRSPFAGHAAAIAATWPPLTDEQLQRVAALLAPATLAGGDQR